MTTPAGDEETQVVELSEEQLVITKVEREREQVRISTRFDTSHSTVDVPTIEEHITILRVPKNVDVDGPLPPRHEGDTMIISLVEEVPVLTTKFVLKEELRITKQRAEVLKAVPVTLRREYATVDRKSMK